MCDPVTLGIMSFAVGAAQTVMGFAGASEDAKNAREAAVKENAMNQNQLTLRSAQEADATSRKTQLDGLEAAQIGAEVEAGAAAGGVGGISVGNILGDVKRRSAMNRTAATENLKMTVAQINQDKRASVSRAQGKIAAARAPNPLGLVAGLAGDAFGGYNAYSKAKNRMV